MHEPETSNSFLAWHAWAATDTIAVKLTTIFPDNPASPEPRPGVQAIVIAFHGVDGSPKAVIDGTELTYWKTAASSGLAADFLAPREPSTLLMVGAGGLAPYLVMAHRAIRPSIDRVMVWNRTRAKAEALCVHPLVGESVEVVDDLEAAVAGSDVISCATASDRPLIQGELLQPGAHVDLVGGFTRGMREADNATIRRARLFLDSFMFTMEDAGDICIPLEAGVIDRSDLVTDLLGLCRGVPGRMSDDEITLYKSAGGAHLDLMATKHVLEVLT